MNLKTNQCPASKSNSPSPYPGTESFKLAPDNIISIIMDTGAVGNIMLPRGPGRSVLKEKGSKGKGVRSFKLTIHI